MDTDIKKWAKLAADLCRIYDTLSGEANIEEPYSLRSFNRNGKGHITVKGSIRGNTVGFENTLVFSNLADQTNLKPLCFALQNAFR